MAAPCALRRHVHSGEYQHKRRRLAVWGDVRRHRSRPRGKQPGKEGFGKTWRVGLTNGVLSHVPFFGPGGVPEIRPGGVFVVSAPTPTRRPASAWLASTVSWSPSLCPDGGVFFTLLPFSAPLGWVAGNANRPAMATLSVAPQECLSLAGVAMCADRITDRGLGRALRTCPTRHVHGSVGRGATHRRRGLQPHSDRLLPHAAR